mmetsp:Transcript_88975/g.252269  ORF Transcript_88975/g.252269 Transcript_88975/m.252269 type:complete len:240 (+) Transcript_88975:1-720(+)
MAMTVDIGKPRSSAPVTVSWVPGSSEEVHSSRRSTGGCRMVIRARLRSCFWPKLRFPPSSETREWKLSGEERTKGTRCTLRSASQTRPSEYSSKGSTLKRTVPAKSVGSWGTRPTTERSVERPTLEASRSPRRIRPPRASRIRRMQSITEDFPQPVGPAMPTFAKGGISKLTPCRTFFPTPYPAVRSCTHMCAPCEKLLLISSIQTATPGLINSSAICLASCAMLFTALMSYPSMSSSA